MAKKILFVDDEMAIQGVVKKVLGKEGFGVDTASSGSEALGKLKDDKYDLVLLDFFMPEMSGEQVAEAIRKDAKLKSNKIAFLTVADFGKKGQEKMKKLKVLDYIAKPFDNKDLIKRIKKIIG